MYTIVTFPEGRQVDALLLSASPERLRVAIPGRGDVVELQRIGGQWTSDRGEPVELGAILTEDPAQTARVLSNARPRTMAIGSRA